MYPAGKYRRKRYGEENMSDQHYRNYGNNRRRKGYSGGYEGYDSSDNGGDNSRYDNGYNESDNGNYYSNGNGGYDGGYYGDDNGGYDGSYYDNNNGSYGSSYDGNGNDGYDGGYYGNGNGGYDGGYYGNDHGGYDEGYDGNGNGSYDGGYNENNNGGYNDGYNDRDDIQDFWEEQDRDAGRNPTNHSGSGRKRGIGHFLFNLIPVAAIIVLVVSGYFFFRDWKNYHDAGQEYAQVGEMIQQPAQEETSTETIQEEVSIPDLNIDFEGLQQTNSDFIGVLYVPALGLTYPFVNGVDNEIYLHTTFSGTENPSGCIFLDCNSSTDLSDRFSIIYGHNMKNMTMFGSLKKFSQDASLAEGNPYFYLYLPDRTLKYRIYSYETISNQDDMYYEKTETDDQYDALVSKFRSSSQYAPDDLEFDFSDRPDLVTLSTCWGTAHVQNFIVNGALVEVQENEDTESSESADTQSSEESSAESDTVENA